MTIEIPAWLLWTLGIGLGVTAIGVTLFFAFFGWQFFRVFKDFRIK